MNGPTTIDPAKLAAAKQAYQADLAANHTNLTDQAGNSHAADPFNINPDGSTSFNRWTDASNRRSAQDSFITTTKKNADGTTTSTKAPAWQEVPNYYFNQSKDQFDYISTALKSLQTEGFTNMKDIYTKAMKKIG
jgi:hypothetical protein